MKDYELKKQEIIVSVFNSLKMELESNQIEMVKLGYAQRSELYKHVNNGYNNHDSLNKARIAWEQNGVRGKAMKWIYDLFVENRDLFGYFENYEKIIKEIDFLIERSIYNEMYDITEYLTEWRKKLP